MENKTLKDISLGMNRDSDISILSKYYPYQELPYYKGNGNHSVKELEQLCRQFTEYCHQQAVIKQHLIDVITNL